MNLLLSLCSRLSRIDRSLLALERAEMMQEDTAEERVRLAVRRSLYLCPYLPTDLSVSSLPWIHYPALSLPVTLVIVWIWSVWSVLGQI